MEDEMKYAKVITGDVVFNGADDYSDVEEIGGSLNLQIKALPMLTAGGDEEAVA